MGTTLEGKVNLANGTQLWTVPVTGSYTIEAFGASGADGTYTGVDNPTLRKGGPGAKIKGAFHLVKDTRLKILVGQMGEQSRNFPDRPGGGGGGTFVTMFDNTPLIIAGGGGGGSTAKDQFESGDPGQATENGTRCGGTAGMGGEVCSASTGAVDQSLMGSGGAGLLGNGAEGGIGGSLGDFSVSFIKGGIGGKCPSSHGGFGGGGYAMIFGGGGGGYSGGGVVGTSTKGAAGGGGSYNGGSHQQNTAAINKGDGKVIVTLTRP